MKELEAWVESDAWEVPVLLVGGSEEALMETMKEMKDKFSEKIIIESDKATITVKQIKELLGSLSVMPTGKRLILIREAHKMSPAAVSALLKNLEEPNDKTRYILTTIFPRQILATVRSRCRQIHLTPSPSPYKGEGGTPLPSVGDLGKRALSDDELASIYSQIQEQISRGGVSEARVALTRLRDVYKVRAQKGNEPLASQLLLMSLPK